MLEWKGWHVDVHAPWIPDKRHSEHSALCFPWVRLHHWRPVDHKEWLSPVPRGPSQTPKMIFHIGNTSIVRIQTKSRWWWNQAKWPLSIWPWSHMLLNSEIILWSDLAAKSFMGQIPTCLDAKTKKLRPKKKNTTTIVSKRNVDSLDHIEISWGKRYKSSSHKIACHHARAKKLFTVVAILKTREKTQNELTAFIRFTELEMDICRAAIITLERKIVTADRVRKFFVLSVSSNWMARMPARAKLVTRTVLS